MSLNEETRARAATLNFATPQGPGNAARLPIAWPEGTGGDEFLDEVRRIIKSGQLTNGPRVRQFEELAAGYLGVRHCVAVSSCTAGLLLTLQALGLRGEVILPSFTFHATAHSVLWNGLKPVFADCDEQTFCIDPAAVHDKLSPATAAILAVHMFGCPAPVGELEKLSMNRGIPLVYDAAHAFGSKSNGAHIGTFGVAEVFSFSPTKLIVAAEGGLVATNDTTLAKRLQAARNYGDLGDGNPCVLGLNARMSEFHAALACAGFGSLESRIKRRNEVRFQYIRRLEHVPGVSFQKIDADSRSACKDMALLINERVFGASRDSLLTFLREQGIEARRYFCPPVHRQSLYSHIWDGRPLPITECVSSRILNVPIYSSLTDQDVNRVCDSIACAHELAQDGGQKPVLALQASSFSPCLTETTPALQVKI